MTKNKINCCQQGFGVMGAEVHNLSICTSINICGLLNIRTFNPPLRQAPNRYTQALLYGFV